ncbi:HNH endonuclease signature motif containing protein [Nocardioides zeae]|uniref:DUF222 domain-containing protein n=1 Tax=Nocardioides zeae TaxID=1457234 RepID=A0A6P0HIE6_9ACTN|nr:HNH endonuclease signature motif containing protein [Nocardioides zeae]NEN78509.1 DUF222 domain-containing protein [Nocardioides zeae]
MTGVSSSGDADGFEPPVPEPPGEFLVDEPVPDWLEHAFTTGEWPAEATLGCRIVDREGRYDASEPVAEPEPGWAVPGVASGAGGVDLGHPVLEAIRGATAVLDADGRTGLGWLSAPQTGAALIDAHRLVARASALVAVLVQHAEDVELHRQNGASTAAVWLANAATITRRDAYRFARVGGAIDGTATDAEPGTESGAEPGGAVVDAGLSTTGVSAAGRYRAHLGPGCLTGVVNTEQADVIVKALDALPDELPDQLRLLAEETLVGFAADHDAKALRALGKKILTVIAPEVGEAHDAALLEREEREARAASRLSMVSDGHGKVHGRFTLPELHGAMLRKALDAYAAPKHLNTNEDPEQRFVTGRPTPERYGRAFQQLLEMLDHKDLPATGGMGATVVVTMTLESLRGGLASASLDTGGTLSASEARRLACEAGIIPAVLGTKSEVLDLGRTTRFHTRAMRLAMAIRDGGCVAEGCTRPPHQTHAHHLTAWFNGGHTTVNDGCLLCDQHHHQIHDPLYLVERLGTGKLRFTRRT